jgi:hypothetical protein
MPILFCQGMDPDPHLVFRLDPDPHKTDADPKHCKKQYLCLCATGSRLTGKKIINSLQRNTTSKNSTYVCVQLGLD